MPRHHCRRVALSTLALSSLLLAPAACSKESKGDSPAASVPGGDPPAGGAGAQVPVAPSRGDEHPVYSLADNRLAAHVQRDGGLVVSGATQGFVKYIRYRKAPNWTIGEKRDGAVAAVLDGSTGKLVVPLTKAQADGAVRVRLRVHTASASRVGVRVNGNQKAEKTAQLPGGWTTAEVTIDGAFHAGENEILLFAVKGADFALAWAQIGGSGAAEPEPAFWDGGKKAIAMPEHGGMAWYLMVPDHGLVTGDLDDGACKVAVTATPDQGKPVQGTLSGRGSAVDLAALAGKAVRLDLVAQGCKQARLSGAALLRPGKAPEYSRAKGADKPRYVVFWIMDSLRADRVRLINPKARPESPFFDSLGKTSTVFVHHYVQGNESMASHATMWTSEYPGVHRYFGQAKQITNPPRRIDAAMKRAGFYTAGESSNGFIIPRHGFGDDWDYFHNHIHEETGLTAEDIVKPALAAVDGKKDPWFLYIGTVDTHVAWKAHEPWTSKYDPEPYSGQFDKRATGDQIGKIATGKMQVSDRDKQRIIALYDTNVSYQDQQLKLLFDQLTAWGIADDTMVIVTADHGDEQFEDGRVGHGQSLRETLVHVPLIIHYPRLFPATRIDQATEAIDVMPTLVDAIGGEAVAEWQGRSMLPLAHGVGAEYPEASFSSQYEDSFSMRQGPWKIRLGGRGTSLANAETDLLEQDEGGDRFPVAEQAVNDVMWLMRAHNKEWRKTRWGNPANVTARFTADLGE